MPWTAADAKGHTKKADTPAKQKKWAKIANAALEEYGDEGKAIAVANAAMDRSVDGVSTTSLAGAIDTRFADVAPQSYDRGTRTVDCVISMGSPVKRFYGTEVLRITPSAVDLTRMQEGGIPVLDHHNQGGLNHMLGRVVDTWFRRGALMGKLKFNQTPEGEKAEGMVARGEIAGVSAGYRVDDWEITDDDGNKVDPDKDRLRWDENLTFTATRWQLFECSLVGVPADGRSLIRSFGSGRDRQVPEVDDLATRAIRITKRFGDAEVTYEFPRVTSPLADIRARMRSRQSMHERMLARK